MNHVNLPGVCLPAMLLEAEQCPLPLHSGLSEARYPWAFARTGAFSSRCSLDSSGLTHGPPDCRVFCYEDWNPVIPLGLTAFQPELFLGRSYSQVVINTQAAQCRRRDALAVKPV